MVAEIIEYRIASYVLNKEKSATRVWSCRLVFADGNPIIRLDRRQSVDLPTGVVSFIADGHDYQASFDKGTVSSATREGTAGNALPGLLREWFGSSAGHPGTSHRVRLEQTGDTFLLQAETSGDANAQVDYVPLLGDYTVAVESGAHGSWREHTSAEIAVRSRPGEHFSSSSHFVCFAHADASTGVPEPIRTGDPLLFEWIGSGSVDQFVDQPVLVDTGVSLEGTDALRVIRHAGGGYTFEAVDPGVEPIPVSPKARPVARLVSKLNQRDINPLADRIGEQFKSMDVPPLYGEVYNPGNWRSGHVSLDQHAILFVTLEKRADRTQYEEKFDRNDVFKWSSQLSTKPTGKKGREILDALKTGKSIEMWMRRKSADPFTYVGRVVPLGYEGSEPMAVTYRLLTPLTSDLQHQLGVSTT
jgi:hypothetical protein